VTTEETTATDKLAITIGSLRRWLAKRRACWMQDFKPVDGGSLSLLESLEEWNRYRPGILIALNDLDETLGDDERGPGRDLDVVDESSALVAANLEIQRLRGELERLGKTDGDPVRILSPVNLGGDSFERVVARITSDAPKNIKSPTLDTTQQDWVEIDLGNGVRKRVRRFPLQELGPVAFAPAKPAAIARRGGKPAKARYRKTVLLAFTLRDRTGYHEACELVFGRTARDARKNGYLDGVDFINLEVTRSPKFDEFAGVPGRPNIRDKLERGWWQNCGGCHDFVRLDGGESDAAKIITETDAFCNEMCQATHEGIRRGLDFANAERAEAWPEGMTKPERMWRPSQEKR